MPTLAIMTFGYQVTFDAADPAALARFWALALGWIEQPPPAGFETWEAFADAHSMTEEDRHKYGAIIEPGYPKKRILFVRVPEPKVAKNRIHLDIYAGGGSEVEEAQRRRRIDEHVQKLTEAGATELARHGEHGEEWVVMADPEGNEFCVV